MSRTGNRQQFCQALDDGEDHDLEQRHVLILSDACEDLMCGEENPGGRTSRGK
jgi:hypothetical protein